MVNGAIVHQSAQNVGTTPGRSILMVPSSMKEEIVLALSWTGPGNQVDIFALTSQVKNKKQTSGCQLGYFQPKCRGITLKTEKLSNHHWDKDGIPAGEQLNGASISINSEAFDTAGEANKSILVYLRSPQLMISETEAQVDLFVPE